MAKVNTAKLQKLMAKAALLALKHGDAVLAAQREFERVFGEPVPEEGRGMISETPKERVGSIFNDITNHAENLTSLPNDEVGELIAELMAVKGED